MRKQDYAGTKGTIFLMVVTILILMFLVPQTIDCFLELNEPIKTIESYSIDEISGKIVKIQDFQVVNCVTMNDEDKTTKYIINIKFADQTQDVFMEVSEKMQGTMNQNLIQFKSGEISKSIDGITGKIKVTSQSDEIFIEFREIKISQVGDIYYNENVLVPALISLVFAIILIVLIFRLFTLIKRLKQGHRFKNEENYHFISQQELTSIIKQEPTFDNVWIKENYLLINNSFLVDIVKYSDVIWIYIDTYSGNHSTTYYIKLNDIDGNCTTITLIDPIITESVFKNLLILMPNVIIENTKEIAKDYKNDTGMFKAKYISRNSNYDNVSQPFSSKLTDDQLDYLIVSNNIDEIEKDIKSSKIKGKKANIMGAFTLILVLFAVIGEMGLIFLSDKYVPNLVRDYFLKSDINPAISFFSAILYSVLINGVIIMLIMVLFVFIVIKLCKKNTEKSANTGQFLIIGLLFGGFAIIIPFFLIFDGFSPKELYEIHQDFSQIKNDELSYTDVYIIEMEEINSKDFFSIEYSEKYNHYMITAVDITKEQTQMALRYHFPWKVVPNIDTSLSNYDFTKSIEDNNQSAIIYRLYHTSNFRVITETEIINE